MSQPKDDKKKDEKAAYETPKLIKVDLRPEEAILGACKTSSSMGPSAPNCAILSCSSLGS